MILPDENLHCSSVTRQLTKQDKIRYRLGIRLDIRLCLYIDTHSRLPIITTCFVQLPACLLVAIPSSHHSHCQIGLLQHILLIVYPFAFHAQVFPSDYVMKNLAHCLHEIGCARLATLGICRRPHTKRYSNSSRSVDHLTIFRHVPEKNNA